MENPARKTALAETTLSVEKLISASPAEVFNAFTDPKILVQWMGPEGVSCLSAQIDLVLGGKFRIHMQSEQGDHIAVGEYLEIDIPNKLVFSWSWETGEVKNTEITLNFKAEGSKTKVVLVHEKHPDKDSASKHSAGWTSSLENLADLFPESNKK